MSIDLISNGESGLSARTKINAAIAQLNSGSFDTVSATNNGNGTNFKVGDDAWIGDVNLANTIQIKGQQDAAKAFIKFSSGSNSTIIGGTNDGYFQVTGSMFILGTYNQSNINIVDYNQKGGAGYTGFLTVTNTAPGATTPNKFFRLNSTGSLQIIDSAYQNTIFQLTDGGNLTIRGGLSTSGSNTFIGNQTITGSLNLTGSLNIVGDQTTIGNRILTGSWFVTGSSYLVGNNSIAGNTSLSGSITISGSTTNTIIGNTNVYGAFNVSGSSIFSNSFFTVTGSTFVKGATNISGSTNITGSLNVIGDINVVSGSSFTRWGNKLFNYGAFSSTQTQTSVANTILSMSFNSTDVGGSGVSLVNGSKITVENTGVYNLQFSSQFNRTNNGTDTITVWFAYTGSSIANSATDVVLTGGASVNATVASWNYVLPMSASSYVQIFWSTPDVHVEMSAIGTRTVPTRPAVPSVIATLTQIA